MKFRKRPIVIDATQWFKNGDHPEDTGAYMGTSEHEGHVVRYYRTPEDDSELECGYCDLPMHDHGWIDTFEGGHVVCPGDWIITGVNGEYYPCKPDIFEKMYEAVLSETGGAGADPLESRGCMNRGNVV